MSTILQGEGSVARRRIYGESQQRRIKSFWCRGSVKVDNKRVEQLVVRNRPRASCESSDSHVWPLGFRIPCNKPVSRSGRAAV